MLIVMHHGNIQQVMQTLLNVKTPRRRNIFQLNSAKGRRNRDDRFNDLVRILRSKDDGDGINVCEFLKNGRLPFHHWQCRERSDVSQSQHRRSIRDNGHGVALPCESVGELWLLGDNGRRSPDARRVYKREITKVAQGHLRSDLYLAAILFVKRKGFLFELEGGHRGCEEGTAVATARAEGRKSKVENVSGRCASGQPYGVMRFGGMISSSSSCGCSSGS